MARQKVCAGNWKLNKNSDEVREYFTSWLAHPKRGPIANYVFYVPAYFLPYCATVKESGNPIQFGAQICYSENSGAFTGEISAQVVAEFGAHSILVGHSERRQIFGESNALLAKKVTLIQSVGLTPVLCIGESLAEREAGETESVLAEQLREGLALADLSAKLFIAYEPVWAIGTGKVATTEQVEDAHAFVREKLDEMGGADLSERTPILYGGSVKPDNAKELGQVPDVDGFLVGGASLKVTDFVSICNNLFQN